MTDRIITGGVSIVVAIIGVAILAVIVQKGSGTTGVISAGSSAFNNILCHALSPLTGSSCGQGTATSTISYN